MLLTALTALSLAFCQFSHRKDYQIQMDGEEERQETASYLALFFLRTLIFHLLYPQLTPHEGCVGETTI